MRHELKNMLVTQKGDCKLDPLKLKPGMYDVTVSFSLRVTDTGNTVRKSAISIEVMSASKLSRDQQKLMRGLERVLYVVSNGRVASSKEYDAWHEECLLAFAPIHKGALGRDIPIRSADFTKKQASDYCNKLIGEILTTDNRGMAEAFDVSDIRSIFTAFHLMYFDAQDFKEMLTWDKYREKIPFCEFTFGQGSMVDPLERMHIISAGANGGIYEEPWNWIHALHSVHMLQHAHGWEYILDLYPHMTQRVEYAKEMERRICNAD